MEITRINDKKAYIDMLIVLIEDEEEAIDGYEGAIEFFNTKDDNAVYIEQFNHILLEEQEHIEELKELLVHLSEE